jgi:hypothetical protein
MLKLIASFVQHREYAIRMAMLLSSHYHPLCHQKINLAHSIDSLKVDEANEV